MVRRYEDPPRTARRCAREDVRDHRSARYGHQTFVGNAVRRRERIDRAGAAAGEEQDRTRHAASRCTAAAGDCRLMLSATLVALKSDWVTSAATAVSPQNFSYNRLHMRLTSTLDP